MRSYLRLLSLMCFVGLTHTIFAQKTGVIDYAVVEVEEQADEMSSAEKFLLGGVPPVTDTTHMSLYFNDTESLYRNAPVVIEAANERIRRWRAPADDRVYMDFTRRILVEQKDFLDKLFLITDSLPAIKWKLSTETRIIKGNPCIKATATDTGGAIEAWFTPQIPLSSGPGMYGGLPGLILELSVDDGKRKFFVDSIDIRDLKNKELAEPKSGKRVTRERYNVIVEEKNKEREGR